MLIVRSVGLVDLIVDPVVASEGVLVVLGRLAPAIVDQLFVENHAGKSIPDFE